MSEISSSDAADRFNRALGRHQRDVYFSLSLGIMLPFAIALSMGVLIRIDGDEVCACALRGTIPMGSEARYIYGVRFPDGSELPTKVAPCVGRHYGERTAR